MSDENLYAQSVLVKTQDREQVLRDEVYDAAMALFEAWRFEELRIDKSGIGNVETDDLIERFVDACRRAKEGRDG